MAPRIAVIGLTPGPEFARFLRALRERYPEAAVTAVVGTPELQAAAESLAEDCLLWSSTSARRLLAELRRGRFALLALPYNREYRYTLAFWKALALTVVSRARGVLLCENARLPEPSVPLDTLARPRARATSLLAAAASILVEPPIYLARETAIAVLSSLLAIVALGIAAVDGVAVITEAVARRRRSGS